MSRTFKMAQYTSQKKEKCSPCADSFSVTWFQDILIHANGNCFSRIFKIIITADNEYLCLRESSRTIRLSDSPSINGILISVISTSGRVFRISGSATSPSAASPTNRYPYCSQGIRSRSPSRITVSSSTKNTFNICFIPFNTLCLPKQKAHFFVYTLFLLHN